MEQRPTFADWKAAYLEMPPEKQRRLDRFVEVRLAQLEAEGRICRIGPQPRR